jgi:glycosyltransferase involved in cell wall biosynthesis
MKILGLSHPQSGCGYHRVVLPLITMPDVKGIITNYPSEETLADKYDILLFNRVSQFDGNFEHVRNQLGCKIVVDMDDDWELPSNHLNYADYQRMALQIEQNLMEADMVTCTHERLAAKIYPLNKNVLILPNAIPFDHYQFIDKKVESDLVRIFWCGGITHEGDLEIIKNPVRRLQAQRNKIQMVIGGYNQDNPLSKWLWDKMVSYFTDSKKLNHEVINSMSVDKYMAMYEQADIMLVPLLKSDWAAGKSNLKLLEASVKSVPVICSAVEPYINDIDAPVLWVHKQSDWYKHLNFLINDKAARLEYGKKINEWAKRKYNLVEVNATRKATFADLIKA